MKNQNLIQQFAINLREIRESKKLTQTAMSKVLRTSPAAYGQYEKGTRQPSLSALATIAKYFHMSTDKLIFDDYQQSKTFWTDCGYSVDELDGGEISFTLPVPTAQIVISNNGNVTSLQAKERKIIFADKKAFVDFTDKTQKKFRADFIGKCNEEVLNLYHRIEEGDSEINNVHVQEMRIEKKYPPAK